MQKKDFIYLGIIFLLLITITIAFFSFVNYIDKQNRESNVYSQMTEAGRDLLCRYVASKEGFCVIPTNVMLCYEPNSCSTGIEVLLRNNFNSSRDFTTTIGFYDNPSISIDKSLQNKLIENDSNDKVSFFLQARNGDFKENTLINGYVNVTSEGKILGSQNFVIAVGVDPPKGFFSRYF